MAVPARGVAEVARGVAEVVSKVTDVAADVAEPTPGSAEPASDGAEPVDPAVLSVSEWCRCLRRRRSASPISRPYRPQAPRVGPGRRGWAVSGGCAGWLPSK
ncbi:hypothetical protein GCM10012279_40780 [Micromonospora yangpuensis]|nr:hypothetical protein GCM10012279_40780 [Micromonospora yangpuensis]